MILISRKALALLRKRGNQPTVHANAGKFARLLVTIIIVLIGCAYAPWAGAQPQRTRLLPPSIRVHKDFKSQFLPKSRQLFVYLPSGYQENEAKRYPVLYLLDGANVFVVWEIDETVRVLVEASQI